MADGARERVKEGNHRAPRLLPANNQSSQVIQVRKKRDSDAGLDLEGQSEGPSKKEAAQQQTVYLCFDLTPLAPAMQFIILSLGLFAFFMIAGFVEEYLFRELPKFEFGWYLTWFELVCFATFALIERKGKGEQVFQHNAHLKRHLLVALAMTASRGLTNQSLQYLNFPTQVIFKSMKLITVMVGSVVMLGKSYAVLEYVAACMLVISAILFSLGDADVSPEYNMVGITIVLISLVADAVHSNTQESLLKKYGASLMETMFFTNIFAAGCCFLIILFDGELFLALEYCREYPIAYVLFVIRSLFIYGGVLSFVTLIKRFGVVLATTLTTVRKILTILVSFIVFPKAPSMKYVYGFLIFCGAVCVNLHVLRAKKHAAPSDKK